jgi:hypothetical protein
VSYEPAINTTESPVTDANNKSIHYWLDRATEAAQREGRGIVGFVVTKDSDGCLVLEPFSSSSLSTEEFISLVTSAVRQMMEKKVQN